MQEGRQAGRHAGRKAGIGRKAGRHAVSQAGQTVTEKIFLHQRSEDLKQ